MPIRINLLAEAQAAEELRRKDPVKRALLAAAVCIFVVVLWGSMLQCRILSSKSDLGELEAKWKNIEPAYNVAVESQRQVIEGRQKLAALEQLTTNRFLWGTALNAFQQTLKGVKNVQVTRLKTEQSYLVADNKAATNSVRGAGSAFSTEKISMTIEASDSSPQPGGQVSKFKEVITSVPFFRDNLQQTNGVLLTSLSAPQSGPQGTFVLFNLQCFFPEKVRY